MLSLWNRQKLGKLRLRSNQSTEELAWEASSVRLQSLGAQHSPLDSAACLGCWHDRADPRPGPPGLRGTGGEPGSEVEGEREEGGPHDCRGRGSSPSFLLLPANLTLVSLRAEQS